MKIRLAEAGDIPELMRLGRLMHAESRFRKYPLDPEKLQHAMEAHIADPRAACILVAEREGNGMVGFLAGYVVEFFFCAGLSAQDRGFFVHPAWRGSSAALKLLVAFRRWAENRRVLELCINMSVDVDRERFDKFMEHMGFRCCGSNFSLTLGA